MKKKTSSIVKSKDYGVNILFQVFLPWIQIDLISTDLPNFQML